MAQYTRDQGIRLTQKDLEAATGIAQSTISTYVTNSVSSYHEGTVLRLLLFFDVTPGEFFVVVIEQEEEEEGELEAVQVA